MGLYDSFSDEDSECPKCHLKVREWQTKHLRNLLENWKKGEFLQYHKLERIPDEERRQRDGSLAQFPVYRRSSEYVSAAPLVFYGKVPVHTNCGACDSWLEAYAKILKGRFTGIVEVDTDGDQKDSVLLKPDTSAKELRQEFSERLSQLQDSCDHTNTQWTIMEWAPGHLIPGKNLVCLNCEKIIETKNTA